MVDEQKPALVFFLTYGSLLLSLLSCYFLIIFLIALSKIKNFTPDLKVILMDVGTAYSVHIVTSVIEIITSIAWSCNTSPNLEVVASIRVTALFACCFNMVLLTVERVVATVTFKGYEGCWLSYNLPQFSPLLIVIQWLTSWILYYGYIHAIIAPLVPYYIFSGLYIIIIFIFVALPFLALRIQQIRRKRLVSKSQHSLVERHHLLRNVKTVRLLNPFVLTISISSIIWIIMGFIRNRIYHTPPDEYFRIIFYAVIPAQVIIATSVFMSSNGNTHSKLFARLKCWSSKEKVCEIPAVNMKTQSDIYFSTYAQAWSQRAKTGQWLTDKTAVPSTVS